MIDFIIAVLVGMLAGLGMGSGGFLIIYLVFIRDVPQSTAQGINLWFFIFALAASCAVHMKKRRPDKKLIIMMTVPGIIGVLFGGYIFSFINTAMLSKIFGIFLIGAGAYTVFSK